LVLQVAGCELAGFFWGTRKPILQNDPNTPQKKKDAIRRIGARRNWATSSNKLDLALENSRDTST
jgi:hypothetical protein